MAFGSDQMLVWILNMNKINRPIDFSKFPYKDLEIIVPRRQLIQTALQQLHIFSQPARQNSSFKLSSLGKLEMGKLKPLVPVIPKPFKLVIQNGMVCIHEKKAGTLTNLCYADDHSTFIVSNMDGKKSIAEIAYLISRKTGLATDQCLEYTRGFFLTLVSYGKCVPANKQF
jgi:hypothetical protein